MPDLVLVCRDPESETPRLFASRPGVSVFSLDEFNSFLEETNYSGPVVVWGSPVVEYNGKTFNNVTKFNKFKQAKILLEHGVKTIPVALTPFEAYQLMHIPEVVERKLNHSRGTNVKLLYPLFSNIEKAGYYYSPFISFRHEYRVHVINDEVILASHKKHEEPFIEEIQAKIKSSSNGWVFAELSEEFLNNWPIWPKVKDLACSAVRALDYDFGAVDIGVTGPSSFPDTEIYVIEVNSAPGLIESHVKKYVKKFKEVLEHEHED